MKTTHPTPETDAKEAFLEFENGEAQAATRLARHGEDVTWDYEWIDGGLVPASFARRLEYERDEYKRIAASFKESLKRCGFKLP